MTQWIINLLRNGSEGEFWQNIANSCDEEVLDIYRIAVAQEIEWGEYLFKDGAMIGLNSDIYNQYIMFIANQRLKAIGMGVLYPEVKSNPVPWVNTWSDSTSVQVAPQEVEISTYLVGQVDSAVTDDDLAGLSL